MASQPFAPSRTVIAAILLAPPLAWAAGRYGGALPAAAAGLLAVTGTLALLLRARRRALLSALAAAGPRRPARARDRWHGLAPWADTEFAAELGAARDEADTASARLVAAQLQLLSFQDVIRHLTTAAGREPILDALLQHCLRRFGVREAACYLPEPGGRLICRSLGQEGGELALREVSTPLAAGSTLATVMGQGRSLLIGDAANHPLVDAGVGTAPAEDGYVAVPVPLGAGPRQADHGVLVLRGVVGPGALDEAVRGALEALGRAAGAVLANAAFYERLSAERGLREAILNGLGAGVIAFGPDGGHLYHNRAARDMLGLPEEALTALTPGALCPELAGHDSPLAEVVAGRRRAATAEVALARPGAPPLAARLTAAVLPAGPDEGGGVLCVLDDLTSLRAMQDQIRQLDKLAAIGRFTSSLAHEIRNPLAGIAAGIDYLRRDGALGEEHHQYIRIISLEIDRLDRIIRNLFTVVRPGGILPRLQSLAPVLERVLAGLGPAAAAKGVGFAVDAPDSWPEVECDADQIQQVLLNLVKNAVEAEAPGAAVRIRAAAGAREPADGGAATGAAEGLVITVENGGEAIAPGDRERVFEPFYSRRPDGTGLGLYVSYNIVKQHGGGLTVECGEPGPTRFRLFLPHRAPRPAEAP